MIGDCLKSARLFVDEMVVLDTGSQDRTREIAQAHGARVATFTWCDDFAAARNAAIELATADWILMLDADEQLDPSSGPHLRVVAAALPPDTHKCLVQVENVQGSETQGSLMQHIVARFFPRRDDIRFTGAIHEDLVYLPNPSATRGAIVRELRVWHYGYDPAVYRARGKDERNTRILEHELARDSTSARTLFYAALQHLVGGRPREAAGCAERFFEHAEQLPQAFSVEAYKIWIQALLTVGDSDALNRVVAAAEEAGGLSAIGRHLLGECAAEQGRLHQARSWLQSALDREAPRGVFESAGIGGWKTHFRLAEVLDRLAEHDQALAQMEMALRDAPEAHRQLVARTAVQIALVGAGPDQVRTWLVHAEAALSDSVDDHLELLQAVLTAAQHGAVGLAGVLSELDQALANANWQVAYDACLAVPVSGAKEVARVMLLASKLREEGAADAALDVLNRALDLHPSSPRFHWLLVRVLSDLDRYEDALNASEVLKHLPGGEKLLAAA